MVEWEGQKYRISRRRLVRGSALVGLGLAGAALVGCGGDEEGDAAPGTGTASGSGGSGASTATSTSSIKRGGSITAAIDSTGVTKDLDPHGQGVTALNNAIMSSHIYRHLVSWEPTEYKIAPEMAESWEASDPQTYTFKLRAGVQFHHGDPMTAEDVVFSHERQFTEGIVGPYKSWLEMVESVETPDEQTVQYKLKYPFITFPAIFAANRTGGIVSRAFTEANDNNLMTVASGTGPWRLKEMVPDERLVFERSDSYFRMGEDGQSLPYLDELTYIPLIEAATAVASIRTGQVMWTRVSSTDADILANEESIRLMRNPQGWHLGYSINADQKPMDDERVRRALQISIDRPDLIRKVVKNGYAVMSVPWYSLPDYGIHPEDMPAHYSAPDLDEANKLIAAAGLSDGFALELHDTGPQTSFTGTSAEVLREQWKAIGADFKNVQYPPGSFTPRDAGFPGHFASAPWTGYPDPDFYVYNWYHSSVAERSFKPGWNDPTLDTMLEEARVETEEEARIAQYKDIQAYMDEKGVQLSLYDKEYNEAVLTDLQGYEAHPQTRMDFGMTRAWLA